MLFLLLAVGSTGISMCHVPGWTITLEDEFNGVALNSSNWVAVDNMTHGPTEKELYLADEVTVQDGTLILSTRKRKAWHRGTMYNYTSGWVESKNKQYQSFGRFEVRAILPDPAAGRQGMWPVAWPAHWLMPQPTTSLPPNVCWPVGGEIDIMEGFYPRGGNNNPLGSSIYMTYHWAKECNKDLWEKTRVMYPSKSNTTAVINFTQYHTYAVEWTKTALRWYVDGELHYEREEGKPASLFIPQWPFYMILNTALTPWANAAKDGGFPVEHIIDRVTWCVPEDKFVEQ